MKTILVAVDGSAHAQRAMKTASGLAAALDATLVLVTVDEPGPLKGAAAAYAHSENIDRRDIGHALLDLARGEATEAGAKQIKTEIEAGEPAEGILKAADRHDADMVVLGARGLSDLQGLIMGSVSHKVLNLTRRPCLIVRE